MGGAENDQRNPATGQILLIPRVLVARDESVKYLALRCVQQLAVRHGLPPHIKGSHNIIAGKDLTTSDWGFPVKQDARQEPSWQTR